MLRMRGALQTLESFGLPALLDELDRAAGELRERLHGMTGYVAPAGAVIMSEPLGRRTRLRLVATGRLFTGASGGGQVRAIHLGGEHDKRTQQAREGIARRNRLQTATRLTTAACDALDRARTLVVDAPVTNRTEGETGQRGDGGELVGDDGASENQDDTPLEGPTRCATRLARRG